MMWPLMIRPGEGELPERFSSIKLPELRPKRGRFGGGSPDCGKNRAKYAEHGSGFNRLHGASRRKARL